MPYEITWEPEGVHRRYHGVMTIDERRRSFNDICGDPRFDSMRFSITDYLAVTRYEVDPAATEEIAALHSAAMLSNPSILIAAVAVRPDVVTAIRHFISLRFVNQPYEVFADEASARAWIAAQRRTLSRTAAVRPIMR